MFVSSACMEAHTHTYSHTLTIFDGINFDSDGMQFVFEQQVLFRVDLRPHGLVPSGWGKGKNLEHLSFF